MNGMICSLQHFTISALSSQPRKEKSKRNEVNNNSIFSIQLCFLPAVKIGSWSRSKLENEQIFPTQSRSEIFSMFLVFFQVQETEFVQYLKENGIQTVAASPLMWGHHQKDRDPVSKEIQSALDELASQNNVST
jgi:hypothetical protein